MDYLDDYESEFMEWASTFSGLPTFEEVENLRNKGFLPATPDDWLDTGLWIRSLPEVKK